MKNIITRIVKYCVVFILALVLNLLTAIVIRVTAGFFLNGYDLGDTPKIILDIVHLFAIMVCLSIVYYILFLKTVFLKVGENEKLFVRQSIGGFDMKNFLKIHMKTTGKNELIIFALYNVPLMMIFYAIEMLYGVIPIIASYFISAFFFSLSYIICVAVKFYFWNKKWNEEEIKKGRTK